MLVPKAYFYRFIKRQFGADKTLEAIVAMVSRDLESHEDENTESAAIVIFKALEFSRTVPVVRIATHCAVLLGDSVLYRAAMQSAASNSPARNTVLETISQLIDRRHEDEPNSIEWNEW